MFDALRRDFRGILTSSLLGKYLYSIAGVLCIIDNLSDERLGTIFAQLYTTYTLGHSENKYGIYGARRHA